MIINQNPVQQFTSEKEAREWVEGGAHKATKHWDVVFLRLDGKFMGVCLNIMLHGSNVY